MTSLDFLMWVAVAAMVACLGYNLFSYMRFTFRMLQDYSEAVE